MTGSIKSIEFPDELLDKIDEFRKNNFFKQFSPAIVYLVGLGIEYHQRMKQNQNPPIVIPSSPYEPCSPWQPWSPWYVETSTGTMDATHLYPATWVIGSGWHTGTTEGAWR